MHWQHTTRHRSKKTMVCVCVLFVWPWYVKHIVKTIVSIVSYTQPDIVRVFWKQWQQYKHMFVTVLWHIKTWQTITTVVCTICWHTTTPTRCKNNVCVWFVWSWCVKHTEKMIVFMVCMVFRSLLIWHSSSNCKSALERTKTIQTIVCYSVLAYHDLTIHRFYDVLTHHDTNPL